MYVDPDLPDALQAGSVRPQAAMSDDERIVLLEGISQTISRMRKEAVEARAGSGIEEIWTACNESYEGIDDANRHEFANAQWTKPSSMVGSPTLSLPKKNSRSTAFVRLTTRYVDMAAAKISEITLPIDDKAFSLDPTPVPTLVEQAKSTEPLLQGGQQVMRPADPAMQPGAPAQPSAQPGPQGAGMVPATVGDLATAQMQIATERAKKAETRIYDWMQEAKYPLEMRKVLHNSAKLGAGILKCPYPEVKNNWARVDGKLTKQSRIVPGMRSINPWNFYPHGTCGENVHDGDYVFECDDITKAKLKKLKKERLVTGEPIYISDMIDRVLEEGPNRCNQDKAGDPNSAKNQHLINQPYKIWYFTGVLERKDMELLGAVGLEDLPDDAVDVNAVITMVNDTVIRAVVNPLESGGFGYRVHNWGLRNGHWAGVGVAEQIAMPQRGVNAATRALFNNAGITAGGQIVVDRTKIEPADGSWEIVPNKVWWTRTDASGVEDMNKAFMSFAFANMGEQLQRVIDYCAKLAEELSNIPLVSQGRQDENSPDTFGAAELQNSNANTLMRSIAYSIDDSITEPVVQNLYEWLLLDDDIPDEEKGDVVINAQGSISMVEKAIQEKTVLGLIQLSKDPAYGLNPKLIIKTYLKGKRINPSDVQYTEDELANMAKQPQPEAPQITAAKIRAQADQLSTQADNAARLQAAQIQANVSVQKSKMDTDRDTAYVQAEAARTQQQHEAKMAETQMKWELAQLDYANQHGMKLEDVKAKLADTAMRLNVQKELSMAALGVDVHKHHTPSTTDSQVVTPPTEPAGRAPNGQAFEG